MEGILILTTISNINSRSFDVEMNKPFTGEEVVSVYPTNDPDEKLQARIVLNTQSQGELSRSIVIGPDEYIPNITDSLLLEPNPALTPDVLLQNNVEYTVEIERDGELAKDNFRVNTYPGIVDCVVNSYGNRIITVDFKYPLKNLLDRKEESATNGDKHDHLTNLYVLYYGLDAEAPIGGAAERDWIGYIDAKTFYVNPDPPPNDYTVYPFRVTLSADGKRLEIQRNYSGIPLGEHKIIVNYAKQQKSLDEYIVDFSENETPVIGKDFIVTRDAIAAKPIGVVSLSRTEVIVKFDKPVILLEAEKNALKLGENLLVTESYERYGYGFNEIKYTLDSNSALPVGESLLTVNPVTDASGYKTQETNLPIVVEVTKPELLVVEQIIDNSEVETKIRLIYSDIMNTEVNGDVSVINKERYQIFDWNNVEKTINSVETRTSDYEFLMKTELLPAGMYKLVVTDVQDELGTVIDPNPTEKIFEVKDYSVPKVLKVIAIKDVGDVVKGVGPDSTPNNTMSEEDNAIVIMFNEPMNVVNPHSAVEETNYLLTNGTSDTDYKLDDDSVALAMKGNEWVRLTIPYGNGVLDYFTINTDTVSIGYSDVKEVKYVTNASGNIYPLCDVRAIDVLVDKLDITGTTNDKNKVLIISDSTVRYVHDSGVDYAKNIFYSVNKEDFLLRTVIDNTAAPGDAARYGETLPILSAKLIDDVTVEFTFAKGSFDSSTIDLELSTIEYEKIQSLDVFGKRILGQKHNNNIINKVKSTLKGISLIKLVNTDNLKEANGVALVAMKFTKDLATIGDDFTAIVQGESAMPVGTDPLLVGDVISSETGVQEIIDNTPSDVVVLKIGVPDVVDNKSAQYFVSTSEAKGGIKTYDTNKNPIEEFVNKKANELKVTNLKWEYNKDEATNKTNYVFTLTFNKDVKLNTGDNSGYTAVLDTTDDKNWKIDFAADAGTLIGTFDIRFSADQTGDPAGLTASIETSTEANKLIMKVEDSDADDATNLPSAQEVGLYTVFKPFPFSIISADDKEYVNLDFQPPSEIV